MFITRGNYPLWSWSSALAEMERLRREMDRLLGAVTSEFETMAGANVFPPVVVSEDKDNFYVRAELPGVDPKDINISVVGKTLTIEGERKPPEVGEGARYHRREREYVRFSRVIGLPADVEPSKVEAKAKDGVLTVVLPKAEAAKPKQITVKAS